MTVKGWEFTRRGYLGRREARTTKVFQPRSPLFHALPEPFMALSACMLFHDPSHVVKWVKSAMR